MPELSDVARRFVLHWGEMGTRWGINRTVAQVHALLYVSERPLTAEEISETLSIARSNASTSLRELQGWGLIKPVHVLGDRRTHFEALADAWEVARCIAEQRKRRELDPTIDMLRGAVGELARAGKSQAHARERLTAMLELLETVSAVHGELSSLPPSALRGAVRMRGKLLRLLPGRKEQ